MPYVYASGLITASREDIWQRIRDFNALPAWHPAIASSELEGEPGVGVVRHFHLQDGGELREKLLALSDQDFSCSYSILESPMPLKNYLATLRLRPVTSSGETFMEWWACFDVTDPAAEKETADIVHGVFASGIQSLAESFA